MRHYWQRLIVANIIAIALVWAIEKFSKRSVDSAQSIAFLQVVIIVGLGALDVLSVVFGLIHWAFF